MINRFSCSVENPTVADSGGAPAEHLSGRGAAIFLSLSIRGLPWTEP